MKTWKDVTYDRLLDEELISYCWEQASKGKRKRKSVQSMKSKKEQTYKGIVQHSDCENLYSNIEHLIDKNNLKEVAGL